MPVPDCCTGGKALMNMLPSSDPILGVITKAAPCLAAEARCAGGIEEVGGAPSLHRSTLEIVNQVERP